jgi:hypothetical protein
MPGEPVSVEFDAQPADFAAWWRFQAWRPRSMRLVPWLGAVALAFGALAAADHYALRLDTVLLLGCLGFPAGYWGSKKLTDASITAWISDQLRGPAPSTQFGRYRVTLDAEGISEEAPNGRHSHRWAAVEDLCETQSHLFMVVAGSSAYVIPKRAFASVQAAEEFLAAANTFRMRIIDADEPR